MNQSTDTVKGFSLIELLIVVAVIGIIAAMAIPSLQSSRRAANEAAAIGYMRTWSSAQELYFQRFGVYATDDDLMVAAGLIGNPDPDRMGYFYMIDGITSDTWYGQGQPQVPGVTGDRYFFIDESGVIRWALGGPATAESPPLGAD